MTGFPDMAMIEAARRLSTDRAPGGRRMGRFRRAWDGASAWVFPAAPPPEGCVVGALWELEPGVSAEGAYWLAHAVRQDLWRDHQRLRGFWPVVRVTADGSRVAVAAGGIVMGAVPSGLGARIAASATPGRRRQWLDWAAAKTKRSEKDKGTCSTRS